MKVNSFVDFLRSPPSPLKLEGFSSFIVQVVLPKFPPFLLIFSSKTYYPRLIPNNPKNHLNKKNIGTIKTAAPAPYFTQSNQPLNATPNLALDIIVLLFFSTSLSSAFAVALKLSNLLPRLLLIFSSSSLIA